MTLVRFVARPMLASPFITGGYAAMRHPAGRTETAAPFIERVAGPLHLPNDPELLVRVNGGVMLGAGTLLALGKLPRLSAFVLILTLAPTTYVGHPFWEEQDPAKRAAQKTQLTKNLSMLGGLLLAMVDTEGRPGLAWRALHATKDVRRAAATTGKQARMAARTATRGATLATVAGAVTPSKPSKAAKAAEVAKAKAAEVAKAARTKAAESAQAARTKAAESAKAAKTKAAESAKAAKTKAAKPEKPVKTKASAAKPDKPRWRVSTSRADTPGEVVEISRLG